LDFRQERLKLLQAGPSVLGRDVVGNGDFQKLACFVNFGYKHVTFRSEENDINGRVRVHYSSRDAALPRGIVVPHQLIIEACTLRVYWDSARPCSAPSYVFTRQAGCRRVVALGCSGARALSRIGNAR
jgi:hypothetical protein